MTDQGFEAFFREQHRSLVALGSAMTGSIESGRDLAQEALARAFKDWNRISQYERPGGWTRRVLVNLAIDANRRRGNERAAVSRLQPVAVLLPDDPVGNAWWAAVRALPDRQCAVVTLYYLEDMSIRDVAEVLGIAEGTVKATLAKSRASLSDSLREAGAS